MNHASPQDSRHLARAGVLYALGAYLFWGLVPGYFKLVGDVPPAQILAHRVVWSVVLLVPLITRRQLWPEVRAILANSRILRALILSTVLIATNWFTFIYAVTTSQIVLTSLGYYMNPLIAVLLGMVLLKERMRPAQWVSVGLATTAVIILTVARGAFPAIPLILASSFALYGLVRKMTPVGPMEGLFVETALLFPVALGVAVVGPILGWPRLIAVAPELLVQRSGWLILAGAVTAIPLLWFANAARRLRLSTLGLLQYISPTCAFLLAVLQFNEPFTGAQRIAFPLIWAGLVIFSLDSIRAYRRSAPTAVRPEEQLLKDI